MNYDGKISIFIRRIKKDDLIVLPLKTQSAIAIGKSIRDYEYRTDMGDDIRHIRHKLNERYTSYKFRSRFAIFFRCFYDCM